SDPAIKRVKNLGNEDGAGGNEVIFAKRSNNRIEPAEQPAGREEIGQNIHPFAKRGGHSAPFFLKGARTRREDTDSRARDVHNSLTFLFYKREQKISSHYRYSAIIVSPALTVCPTWTLICASAGQYRSTREPSIIIP